MMAHLRFEVIPVLQPIGSKGMELLDADQPEITGNNLETGSVVSASHGIHIGYSLSFLLEKNTIVSTGSNSISFEAESIVGSNVRILNTGCARLSS